MSAEREQLTAVLRELEQLRDHRPIEEAREIVRRHLAAPVSVEETRDSGRSDLVKLLRAVYEERRWATGTKEHATARVRLYELAEHLAEGAPLATAAASPPPVDAVSHERFRRVINRLGCLVGELAPRTRRVEDIAAVVREGLALAYPAPDIVPHVEAGARELARAFGWRAFDGFDGDPNDDLDEDRQQLRAAAHAVLVTAPLAGSPSPVGDGRREVRDVLDRIVGGFRELIETCESADRSEPYEDGEARADGTPSEAPNARWNTPREAASHWRRVIDVILRDLPPAAPAPSPVQVGGRQLVLRGVDEYDAETMRGPQLAIGLLGEEVRNRWICSGCGVNSALAWVEHYERPGHGQTHAFCEGCLFERLQPAPSQLPVQEGRDGDLTLTDSLGDALVLTAHSDGDVTAMTIINGRENRPVILSPADQRRAAAYLAAELPAGESAEPGEGESITLPGLRCPRCRRVRVDPGGGRACYSGLNNDTGCQGTVMESVTLVAHVAAPPTPGEGARS